MSLNYDVSKVENYKDLDGQELYEVCVLGMVLDLGEVTEENLPEWYFRIYFYNKVYGEKVPTDFIQRYVGLKTNVSTKTKTQFKNKMMKVLTDNANTFMNKAKGS